MQLVPSGQSVQRTRISRHRGVAVLVLILPLATSVAGQTTSSHSPQTSPSTEMKGSNWLCQVPSRHKMITRVDNL